MKYLLTAEVHSDRDEANMALYAEGVLAGHFRVDDVRVSTTGADQ